MAAKDKEEEETKKKVKNEANGTVDPEESKRLKEEVELEYIPCLFDIDLQVRRGDLVGIAGAVGSGKSSLMSAILGEMRRLTGEVSVRGRIAYVSQQGWDCRSLIVILVQFTRTYKLERVPI